MCLRQIRILAVDDYPDSLEMVSHYLTSLGYNVDIANAGEKAIELVNEANKSSHPYDAVILDIAMTGMTGITAAIKIRENEKDLDKEEKLRIGFFTAHEEYKEMTPEVRERLDISRIWTKGKPLEMVKDLPKWLNCEDCPTIEKL